MRLLGLALILGAALFIGRAPAESIATAPTQVAVALARDACVHTHSAVFSPLSLQDMLALIRLATDDPLASHLQSLAGATSSRPREEGVRFGVWVPSGLHLTDTFAAQVVDQFGADIFSRSGNLSTQGSVDRWLRESSDDTLRAPRIDDNSLVVATSLSFAARWQEPFDRRETRLGVFHALSGDRREPFMETERPLEFGASSGSSVVRLPLSNHRVVEFLLPSDRVEPACRALAAYVASAPPVFKERLGFIYLPRFHVMTDWFSLVPVLGDLGIGALTQPTKAPLRHLVREGPIAFQQVRQSAMISIDERGVTGSAATLANVPLKSPPGLKFTRPFAFVVRDEIDGAVLLAGVYQ
jgi:serine protease inhibitor